MSGSLNTTDEAIESQVAALVQERRRLERELAETKKALALAGPSVESVHTRIDEVGGIGFLPQIIEGLDPKALRGLVDEGKRRVGSGVALVVAVNDGRATVAVGVTDDLTARFDAVDLVRKAVEAIGGQGGGGRPDMAQGGGPDGSKAAAAVEAVKVALTQEAATA